MYRSLGSLLSTTGTGEGGNEHTFNYGFSLQKKIVPGRTGKAKQDDDGRAAARSRLDAIKKAMKDRLQRQEAQAHTAAPETPKEVDKIVFDAGFFRIESPVKSFSGL